MNTDHISYNRCDPLVSVIVPCYNHARFLIECLESIRNQTYSNYELIIIDDASSDNSVELIEQWIAAQRLSCRFVKHEINQGICKSLNHGLSHATGKYICCIASDDVMMPDRLAHQVAIMEALPEKVGVLYGNAYIINERGDIQTETVIERAIRDRGLLCIPEGNIYRILWNGNFVQACTTMVRRQCYEKIGNYDESLFYEDYDMWLRISREFDFAYNPHIVGKYRIVATSITNTSRGRMDDTKEKMFFKHLNSLPDGELKQFIEIKHSEFQAERYYRENREERNACLLKAFRMGRDTKFLLMLIFSLGRLSYVHYLKLPNMLEKSRKFFHRPLKN